MKINGVLTNDFVSLSLLDYLQQQNYDIGKIAVEWNGQIVPKEQYESTFLEDEDVIEIVQFVGGG